MSKARKTAASSGEPDFWRVARDWLHHWLPKVCVLSNFCGPFRRFF